jgi:regulator of CtrA degradation
MWHAGAMIESFSPVELTAKLVDQLYQESMALAEDARDYFDHVGQWDRKRLGPMDRVLFSCESLKVTTRLMHVISWLLVRKAVMAGEMQASEALAPDRRLGRASATSVEESPRLKTLPPESQRLILKSQEIYLRIKRLEETLGDEDLDDGPARGLQQKLMASF